MMSGQEEQRNEQAVLPQVNATPGSCACSPSAGQELQVNTAVSAFGQLVCDECPGAVTTGTADTARVNHQGEV